MNSVHFSTGKDDWGTPQDLFDALNEEFNFTLDPCADNKIQFEKGGKTQTMDVTDIITQVSAKTGDITFILELDGWYKLNTKLHDVKIP